MTSRDGHVSPHGHGAHAPGEIPSREGARGPGGHEHPHPHPHPHSDEHPHTHEHPHPHAHAAEHPHEHGRSGGGGSAGRLAHRLRHALTPHSHEAMDKVDAAVEGSAEGMRCLWMSLAVLGVTTVLQAVVVAMSGSVALLGDTVHNAADALTAVPLAVAFVLGRRAANRRYTYGYGRAEDLAGVVVVLVVAASSALTAYEAVGRLADPREVGRPWAVALAAVIGFAGNEWVARHRVRTGRRIGSAALVADGLHARTDGFTSLAVLLGAGGSALGLPLADPVVGLLITVAIVAVLRTAVREVWRRLMDAVDPALVEAAERALRGVDGVLGVGAVRMRWIGHALRAEAEIVVGPELTVVEAHALAVGAEHALIHAVPRLTAATVHTDHPSRESDPHDTLAHHGPRRADPPRAATA